MTITAIIKRFAPPTLPQPSSEYNTSYFDKFNTVLRLYFNQLDAILQQIVTSAPTYKVTAFTTATSVTVTHNFGVYPVVNVINNLGVVITPATITHNSVNDFTVMLTVATTGNVIAVAGKP